MLEELAQDTSSSPPPVAPRVPEAVPLEGGQASTPSGAVAGGATEVEAWKRDHSEPLVVDTSLEVEVDNSTFSLAYKVEPPLALQPPL